MVGTIYSGRYRIGSYPTYIGITLTNAATQNPATLSNYIFTNSGAAITGQAGTAWTVSNQGILIDYGMGGKAGNYGSLNNPGGIVLLSGGEVINGNTGPGGQGVVTGTGPFYADGRLDETTEGVVITGGVGTVVNDAAIKSSGTGVYLANGGSIFNGAPNDTIAYINAASIISGGPGTIINSGTLAHGGLITGVGIDLLAGGFVLNNAGAYVGKLTEIGGGSGTVVNAGTMNHAVALTGGGTVTNQAGGTILYALGIFGGAGVLTNAGSISEVTFGDASVATNTGIVIGSPFGIMFQASGTLFNGQAGSAGGVVLGANYGVSFAATGLVDNNGTIGAVVNDPIGGAGVLLRSGGTVMNAGLIRQIDGGYKSSAVSLPGGGTLINTGTLSGQPFGAYVLGGTILNAGEITGTGISAATPSAIDLQGGLLINSARIDDIGAYGVNATTATIVNTGVIAVTNTASSQTNLVGVGAKEQAGTVINSGTISAPSFGIVLGTLAPTLINTGTISARYGVYVSGGIVTRLLAKYNETNPSDPNANATLFDSGQITGTGGAAVVFGDGTERLVLQSGAAFNGAVLGGTGSDTMEFAAGIGSLAGIGTSITNFGTVHVDAGADWTLAGTIGAGVSLTNDGTLLANGGTLFVRAPLVSDNAATGTIAVAGRGVVALYGSVASSQTTQFIDLVGTLAIGSLSAFNGTIAGFANGDTIVLLGTIANAATYANHLLTISNNATVLAKIPVSKNYTGSTFSVQQDTSGHSAITTNAPCFAAGTSLLTADGGMPVEALRVGTAMVTASGIHRPVIWLGRRRIDCRLHPRPEQVRPVRIRAEAFGAGMPVRDLLLSPDHAVAWEDVLIPVRYLVNGMTIQQEAADQVEYWHVELASHDVLLAEGLAVESYLDTGNRHQFEGGTVSTLHPEFAACDAAGLELMLSGAPIRRAKAHLLARAASLGYRAPAPFLHLEVAGQILAASHCAGGQYRFLLPSGTRKVTLVSDVAIPAERDPGATDYRKLGVCVSGVVLDGKPLLLNSKAFGAGFFPLEQRGRARWRWTDGNAVMQLPAGAAVLEIGLLNREALAGRIAPESLAS